MFDHTFAGLFTNHQRFLQLWRNTNTVCLGMVNYIFLMLTNYIHTTHYFRCHSPPFLSNSSSPISSVGETSLWYRAKNWTQACRLTASQRTTNWATLHPTVGIDAENYIRKRFFFFNIFGGFFLFLSYNIQHCFICRPSDSTVPTDAGIVPRTVATGALAVRRSNH